MLEFCADGREKNMNESVAFMAAYFRLSPEELAEQIPSGKQTLLANRLNWVRTYLDKAGALRRTKRGHFAITDRGHTLLAQNPDRIDARVLRQFPEFVAFQSPRGERVDDKAAPDAPQPLPDLSARTPEETLQASAEAIFEALRGQLLDRIRELSPSFFERLVVDLIVSMGYGGSRDSVVQRLGKSGDEGIDGVVNEDPLGLDVVYIQAKRYAADNSIGRERIQQFAGALVGQGASKGVFVTTSFFSRGAFEYAQRVPQRIILIDGAELTRLMIRYGVGVRTERTIELRRIDLDYFEDVDA
jgi:restriction system protein